MDPSGIGLFRLAEERLAWLDRRQAVLAQNVANADTPGYQPRDIRPFNEVLARAGGTGSAAMAQTSALHLAPLAAHAPDLLQPRPQARAPDGNAVGMEQQLVKVADTGTAQELATTLYRKYHGMFRLALGRTG